MKGENKMMLCGAEMCRLLTRSLNEDRMPNAEIEVANVREVSSGPDMYLFSLVVRAAPKHSSAAETLANRPPPPHDNAPEHEARHA